MKDEDVSSQASSNMEDNVEQDAKAKDYTKGCILRGRRPGSAQDGGTFAILCPTQLPHASLQLCQCCEGCWLKKQVVAWRRGVQQLILVKARIDAVIATHIFIIVHMLCSGSENRK